MDLTKEERNYVLQKLQTFCKQVFMTKSSEGGPGAREEALLTSADESRPNNDKEAGTTADLKVQ